MVLPVNIDSTYPNSGDDPSVALHQQHHDEIHAKLNGIAEGATANSPDATLLNRANHTGSQEASTISDLTEAVADIIANALEAGTGISVSYNDATGKITISTNDEVVEGSFVVDWNDVRDVSWGFGEDANLDGGFGQPSVVVTSLADTGTGTLRAALTSGSNKYITFHPSLQDGSINLASTITCTGSNITIDGVGMNIKVRNHTLRFSGTNIIIAGLHFTDNNATVETDAVTFRDATTTQIFGVYDCSFDNGADGELDIIWKGMQNVYGTVAGCLFEEHDKTMLIHSGSSDTGDEGNGGAYHVTIAHTVFDRIKQRTPLARDAHVHMYNTLVSRYGDANSGGTPTRMGDPVNPPGGFVNGLWAENCIAYPLGIGEADFNGDLGVNTRESWFSASSTAGNMKAVGTLLMTNAVDGVTTATQTESDPSQVQEPSYGIDSGYPLAAASSTLRTFLLQVAGHAGSKKSPLVGVYKNPAASHGYIAQNQTVTAIVQGDTPSSVQLLFNGVNVCSMTHGGGGTWSGTVSSSIPAPGTIGTVVVRATQGGVTSDSPEYPTLVLPDL